MASAGWKQLFNMAALSCFLEDVSEEELNALIQKAIPEKLK